MELNNKILSKAEINSRVVDALLAIIANGLVATKSDLAERLGSKPSKFSEILNYRMSAGVDMIAKICDWYKVNPIWVLMGRGDKIFRDPNQEFPPYFIEDGNNLDREYHILDDCLEQEDKQSKNYNSALNERVDMADIFYQKTLEQAEIIGQLKARIAQLEKEKGHIVSNAQTSGVANAG